MVKRSWDEILLLFPDQLLDALSDVKKESAHCALHNHNPLHTREDLDYGHKCINRVAMIVMRNMLCLWRIDIIIIGNLSFIQDKALHCDRELSLSKLTPGMTICVTIVTICVTGLNLGQWRRISVWPVKLVAAKHRPVPCAVKQRLLSTTNSCLVLPITSTQGRINSKQKSFHREKIRKPWLNICALAMHRSEDIEWRSVIWKISFNFS